MSGLWAVLVREIRERRAIPLAALALGILPVIVGAIPALTRFGGDDVRENLAVVLGFAFPVAVALGLGASVIGRDVAEGRLGFYFSRPISGLALWAGKMAATTVLIGASALLVVLPAHFLTAEGFAFGADSYLNSLKGFLMGAPPGLPSAALFALPLVLLGTAGAHAAGTMLRSRSGLLPLDLGLLIATLFALAMAAWRIVDAGAPEMLRGVVLALLWGTLAAALAAGAVQVVAGRSDRRRGHLFLSAALWGTLLTGAGILHLALSWAFQTAPADLEFSHGSVVGAPQGNYFALTSFDSRGRLGYHPAFLVDADSARFVRIPAMEPLVFAEQGHKVAWLCSGRQRALCVAQLDATSSSVRTVVLAAGVADSDYPGILAISAEGDRVLLKDASGVAVVETSTGRLVAETKSPYAMEAYFESIDVVRLQYQLSTTAAGSEIALMEWNLRTGQVRETGRFANALWVMDRAAGHLLVTTSQGGLDLRSEETGLLERVILPASAYRGRPGHPLSIQPRFMADGRVAAIVSEQDGDHLEVFPAGSGPAVDRRIDVGRIRLVGESTAGELLLEKWNEPGAQGLTLFVDAATGEVRKKEVGLRPAVWNWRRGLRSEGAPGSLETRLFLTPDGALVDRDPVTGVRRVVVQGRKPQEE